MMQRFEVLATSGAARLGRLRLAHGVVETPLFMPVGTAATVKAMDPDTLRGLGAGLLVCNTYHLYLRPGHHLVQRLGGLQRFMGWHGSILTDSGGYQAFSLGDLKHITDEGVRFRSHIDGSYHMLTPALSLEVQRSLGSDIAMVLDECAPYPCSLAHAQAAVRRTTAWAGLCKQIFERTDDGTQLLFPIIQGATDRELRLQSLRELQELDLPGMAIGGLSVGEASGLMLEVLDWIVPEMPADRPRYLMGVGRPQELIEAVARGVDMFDCVLPTRTARNGLAFTSEGRVSIKNSRYRDEDGPLDPRCACSTCTRFSRAYLRHLYTSGEILSAMLLTHHNLSFYVELMQRIRDAIRTGCFPQFSREALELLQEPARRPGPVPQGSDASRRLAPAGASQAPEAMKTTGPAADPAQGIDDA